MNTVILQQSFLGNSIQAWLTGSAIAAACFIVLMALRRIGILRLSKLAQRTTTDLDDVLVDVLSKTHFLFIVVVSLYIGFSMLSVSDSPRRLLDHIIALTVLLQGGVWMGEGISSWLRRSAKRRMEQDAASATTLTALGFISKLVLWTIILLIALDNLGVNITAFITGLGIGGIAVALALQNILGDLFASLSIVFDKPFVIGDFIVVNDYLGTVEHIGLKTTRLRSLSGEQVIFSNADLLKSTIRNYKRMHERRVVFTTGITYQTPYEKLSAVSRILREIIESQPRVRFDRAHFKEYRESSLIYEVVYYVLSQDYNLYMDIQQEINMEIYRRFEQEGIQFAYPTRTLFVQGKDLSADAGSRRRKPSTPRKRA